MSVGSPRRGSPRPVAGWDGPGKPGVVTIRQHGQGRFARPQPSEKSGLRTVRGERAGEHIDGDLRADHQYTVVIGQDEVTGADDGAAAGHGPAHSPVAVPEPLGGEQAGAPGKHRQPHLPQFPQIGDDSVDHDARRARGPRGTTGDCDDRRWVTLCSVSTTSTSPGPAGPVPRPSGWHPVARS
ncbi:hypothetical protein GCM10017744_092690 [Streptomyces antimycoticus]|uniref:Uncharacterized protein n=1 Tax=Streptomyces antimycoticus TaxID=68175 RepID=A0A4D4K007_9ACTN|nr:hypothetical protein SANT12839_004690 [Streptomyces antimycoticus]